MNRLRSLRPLRQFLLLCSATAVCLFIPSASATGNIVKSDLKGTWQIALRGTTGCGFSAMLAKITMGTGGSGTGSLQTHGQCGDSSLTGQTFTVTSLNPNGSGVAGLSCGPGCGWTFNIQVSPDRTKFNLVDVSPSNPGNYLEGEAILKSAAGNIVLPDLKGAWLVTLYSITGCGNAATLVRFTLNNAGLATNAVETSHTSGCGNPVTSGNTFRFSSLATDGGGIAGLTCGTGCGFTFNVQVSPDGSMMNLVDVSPANPNNYLAGTAIRSSTFADITKTNLAGNWQLALDGFGGCGNGSALVRFTLNSAGVATNAASTGHSGCGDSTTTGNTFTVSTLNPDGSGTAGLTCGPGCGFTYTIQVSPDRSAFNVVQVTPSNPGNFQAGAAFHQ